MTGANKQLLPPNACFSKHVFFSSNVMINNNQVFAFPVADAIRMSGPSCLGPCKASQKTYIKAWTHEAQQQAWKYLSCKQQIKSPLGGVGSAITPGDKLGGGGSRGLSGHLEAGEVPPSTLMAREVGQVTRPCCPCSPAPNAAAQVASESSDTPHCLSHLSSCGWLLLTLLEAKGDEGGPPAPRVWPSDMPASASPPPLWGSAGAAHPSRCNQRQKSKWARGQFGSQVPWENGAEPARATVSEKALSPSTGNGRRHCGWACPDKPLCPAHSCTGCHQR